MPDRDGTITQEKKRGEKKGGLGDKCRGCRNGELDGDHGRKDRSPVWFEKKEGAILW